MNTNVFSKYFSYFIPRTSDLLFIIQFFSVLASATVMLNGDGDLPRHLLMGKYVLEGNSPPTTEIFAYPYTDREYVPHEWGTGVIFYTLYRTFDLGGVLFLSGLLVAGTFLLIYRRAAQNSNETILTFILVLLGALVTSIHWISRPHLFSMLFVAIWLILLDDLHPKDHKRLWVFAVVMLLWANIHAEFIAGFLILGACLAGALWSFWRTRTAESFSNLKILVFVLLLSFASSLINPSGIKTWTTVAGYLNNSYLMSTISETKPPDFTELRFLPLLVLYVISAAILIFRRKSFSLADFLLIAGFGLMNAVSARNAHLFGVVAPFVLARGLRDMHLSQAFHNVGQMLARFENIGKGTFIPSLSAVLLGAFLLAGPLKSGSRFEPDYFPVQAVQWLEQNPQTGHMLNHFNWGGYILLHFWPSQKVFIESQTDTHGDLTREYITVMRLEAGWENVLEGYDIQWVIIPPDWKLIGELKNRNWEMLYEDDTAVILRRP
jgi:hypothetical protein